jgi:hypothetical protein
MPLKEFQIIGRVRGIVMTKNDKMTDPKMAMYSPKIKSHEGLSLL